MLKASFKLFFFALGAVMLLATSGYQRHFDIRRGVDVAKVGTIQMGTRKPPSHSEKLTPSIFDWVRYAMEGGPFLGTTTMNSVDLTDGMNDLQKLHYRADVDRLGQEATLERVEDVVRGYVGAPLTPRGIQFQSATGQ